jgi:hypothetical protein
MCFSTQQKEDDQFRSKHTFSVGKHFEHVDTREDSEFTLPSWRLTGSTGAWHLVLSVVFYSPHLLRRAENRGTKSWRLGRSSDGSVDAPTIHPTTVAQGGKTEPTARHLWETW